MPPFLGARVVKGISLDDIAAYVNETAFFRNQWQFRPGVGRERRRVQGAHPADASHAARGGEDVGRAGAAGRVRLLRRQRRRRRPRSSGRTATGRSSRPGSRSRASASSRTSASRTSSGPIESGELDYAAFHIVTMGAAVSDATAALFAENKLPGLPPAARSRRRDGRSARRDVAPSHPRGVGLRRRGRPDAHGLFRQQYRGGRYSWGYPACPDLEDNAKVADLLAADAIGVSVSEETSWQYHPEQTTSAIICHHPQAKYFVARG